MTDGTKNALNFSTRNDQVASMAVILGAIQNGDATITSATVPKERPTALLLLVEGVRGMNIVNPIPDWVKWDAANPNIIELEGTKFDRSLFKAFNTDGEIFQIVQNEVEGIRVPGITVRQFNDPDTLLQAFMDLLDRRAKTTI